MFQSYSFGHLGPHAKFQNRSYFRLVGEEEGGDLLIIKASLATTEVSAEGCG